MPLIDILIIIAIVLFVLNGLRNGFIYTFGGLIGMFIGFIVSGFVMSWINQRIGIFEQQWVAILIFLMIALIVSKIFGWLVGDEAYRILSVIPMLKPINKMLGGVAGFLEAIIAIGSFSIFVQIYAFDGKALEFIESSTARIVKDASFTDVTLMPVNA